MVAGVPISVYDRSECAGHIITVFIDFTSTGGAKAETITITAGLPALDLSKAHPIICMAYIATENDTMFTDIEDCSDFTDSEMARGVAPAATGEFSIASSTTIEFWTDNDVDGTVVLTYWAAGSAAL